jgi:cellulose synthase/poly-beta-1,6-N-acetylglucosamine synthase-like glycosyltransferase
MSVLQILFWLSLGTLFYCYVGYGLLIFTYNRIKAIFLSAKDDHEFELLPVTMIVAAYNEEDVISQKIQNCFEIDYPAHLLNLIFITDGSTDNSAELVRQYDKITLLHQSKREGKVAALKRAMRFVNTPIVVFSDANSMLNRNCLNAMIRHYRDKKIGGVAGEKKILKNRFSETGEAEGLYWKYESFMKKLDSDFNTVVGAAGELFSIRVELFDPPDDHFILDDFLFSMHVCLAGYKIKYEPDAYAVETPSLSLAEEEKRKIRIAAGAYQSVTYLKQCLNFFKFPLLSIQYFSRRLLRWAAPGLIFLILIMNVNLVMTHQGFTFDYLLVSQGIFYLMALMGQIFISAGWRIGVLSIPFYFMFMNICLVKGFFNFIQGRQTVLWEKAIREAIE